MNAVDPTQAAMAERAARQSPPPPEAAIFREGDDLGRPVVTKMSGATSGYAAAQLTTQGDFAGWTLKSASATPQNMPISWPQLIGGWLSDYTDPAVILAFLSVIGIWLGQGGPVTLRLVISALVAAFIAAEQTIIRMHGSDGLARRLKAMGQIAKDS